MNKVLIFLAVLYVFVLKINASDIGKPFIQLGHNHSVNCVAISKDGKYIVSGGQNFSITLWSVDSVKEIRKFTGHIGSISSVKITNDNKYIISASRDKTIKVWNAQTGNEIKKITLNSSIEDMKLSEDNKYIIAGTLKGIVYVLDLESLSELVKFSLNGQLSSLSISHDGKRIATADANWVTISDRLSGKTIERVRPHIDVISTTFSPDDRFVICGTLHDEILIIDTVHCISVKTIKSKGKIRTLAVSNDNQFIVSVNQDNSITVWDIKQGKEIETALSRVDPTWPKEWDKDKGTKLLTYLADEMRINEIIISQDSKYIVSAGYNKSVKMWDIHTGKLLKEFSGVAKNINSMIITANNLLLFQNLNQVTLINEKKKQKKIFTHKAVNSIAISNDEKYLATVSSKTIKIWDIESGVEIQKRTNELDYMRNVVFSPDNNHFAFYNHRKNIGSIIELASIQNITNTKKISSNVVSALSFSSDGKILASGLYEINLVDISSGSKISTITPKKITKIHALSFSEDGKYILAAQANGDISMWQVKTQKKVKVIHQEHLAPTTSLRFSKYGNFIVSTTTDGQLKTFDIKTQKKVASTFYSDDAEWITITPEGYFDASANGAKYLNVLTSPMEVTSVDAYYETFYRPDIVAASLQDKNNDVKYAKVQKTKLKLSEIKPAPEVEIVDTLESTDKEELKVTLKITPKQKDQYGQIRLYVDGTLIKTDNDRGLVKKKDENAIYKTYTIKVSKGEHSIKALVFNKENTMQSNDALHTVMSTYKAVVKPNIYAVVVGINEYKNPTLKLKYAAADAKLFADTIKEKTKGLFGKVEVRVLTSKADTTKENITSTLTSLQDLNPHDMFIFYVASHGMVEDAKYHMITSNVGALSARKIKQEAISQEELKDLIANIPTTKKFVILDTCNSGALGQALEVALLTRGLTETTAMKVLSRAVGSTIISASSSSQEALEGYKGHGLLTYVLTQGLNGYADSDQDGFVKTLEISNYVEDTVPEIAEREFKRAQYPYVSPLGQGFPIVKVK